MKPLPAKTFIKLVLSIGLLAWFLGNAGLQNTLKELSGTNLWYIPLGITIYLLSQWISAYRWQFLSKRLQFYMSLPEFYAYYLMGMFFNLFMPGSIGGDVGRVIYLARRCQRKKREAMLTLLAERGVGLVALLMITGLICLLPVTDPIPMSIRSAVWLVSGCMLLGFVALQILDRLGGLEKLAERIPKLAFIVQSRIYWRSPWLLTRSVGLSLVVHACMVLIHVLIAQAMGLKQLSVLYLAAVYGLVSLVSVIPLFFNGIGIREGAYQLLLTRAGLGISAHTALAFGLYWFVISVCTSLVGGLVFIKGHYAVPKDLPGTDLSESNSSEPESSANLVKNNAQPDNPDNSARFSAFGNIL